MTESSGTKLNLNRHDMSIMKSLGMLLAVIIWGVMFTGQFVSGQGVWTWTLVAFGMTFLVLFTTMLSLVTGRTVNVIAIFGLIVGLSICFCLATTVHGTYVILHNGERVQSDASDYGFINPFRNRVYYYKDYEQSLYTVNGDQVVVHVEMANTAEYLYDKYNLPDSLRLRVDIVLTSSFERVAKQYNTSSASAIALYLSADTAICTDKLSGLRVTFSTR